MKMKHVLILLLLAISSLGNAQKKTVTVEPVNVARIITYSVMIQDTSTLASSIKKYDSLAVLSDITQMGAITYLDPVSFNLLTAVAGNFLRDTNAVIYDYSGRAMNHKQGAEQIMHCDSVSWSNIDANGQETITTVFYCDSSIFRRATRIDFTESWDIDPKTYEFKKVVLSYALCYYDQDREMWRTIVTIYKDAKAAEKVAQLSGNR